MGKVIITLIAKEFRTEIRQQSTVAGLALYLISAVYISYASLGLRAGNPDTSTWTALFWIVTLFSAVAIIGKSFLGERKGNLLYYHSIVSPQALLLAKTTYGFLLNLVLSFLGWGLFSLFLSNPVTDRLIFLTGIFLVAGCFGATFSLLSGIATKAGNGNVLLAVMGFPAVISILILAVRLTRNCIDGLGWAAASDELLMLLAIQTITLSVSYLLFPYIWRS